MKGPRTPKKVIDDLRDAARAHWLARRPDQAEIGYKKVLAYDPFDAASLEGLGLIAVFRGDEKSARRMFEKALKADPYRGTVRLNLIAIYLQAGDYRQAKAMALHVLAKDPVNGLTHYMLGEAHRGLGELEAAKAEYDLAANASGEMAGHVETAIQGRLAACDWRTYGMETEWVRERLQKGYSLWQALLPFLVSDSATEVARATDVHARWLFPAQPAMYSKTIPRHDRIRIGYITGEMYDHPVGNLIGGVLENHDHDRFEIYAFFYGPMTPDKVRQRLIPTFDHFIEVGELDAEAICKTIRDCEIDIAVTLSGYTRGSRPAIMAYRPAPIQVNYCGFPGTMSAPYIDYMIADRMVIPEGDIETFTEKLVWMPNHYQSADDKAAVSQKPLTRADEGLPEDKFVFMGYNTTNKITPQIFHTWMRILRRTDNSVIWLSPGTDEHVAANLRREAAEQGVDPSRLYFAEGRFERADHIARHRLADLFLDTLPYNAHTTASDALWAGLPVMTCPGTTFPGRVCASILTAAGLPELIADNLADYEELAVSLANDPERLKAIRRRVEGEVRRSPLFDTAAYTRDLEAAYETMYEIHRAGEAPRSFAVDGKKSPAKTTRSAPKAGKAPKPSAATSQPQPAAADIDPHAGLSVEALVGLGRDHWKAGRLDEAAAAFAQVRLIDPSNAAALEGLGLIVARRGNGFQARTLLSEALKKDPSLTEAALGLAPFLAQAGLPNAAMAMIEKVVTSHPDHAAARISHGQLLWAFGEHRAAYESFEIAIALDPAMARIVDTWAYERLGECDWGGYAIQVDTLTRLVRAGRDAAQPFFMMLMSDDPTDIELSARAYAAKRFPAAPALWTGERPRHDRIRLAYLTAEIADHPVTNLLAGVWERHDRSRFEISCYSYGPPSQAPIVRRVQPAFDHFIDASELDAEAIARAIHERQIDIAITLNGYTANSRPAILAHRPAPIQVNYLGFPGTMGVPYIDYLIADRRVVTEDEAVGYHEQIVWMPDAYQPTDDAEPRPAAAPSRAEAGLPRNAFVFMAFNHSYKITPAVFDTWMRILKRVPHGVLWLADKDETMRVNLQREAAARGVKPDRLIFAPRVADRAAHLARHGLADLFLDTLPYTAHATASDALWAGLPILTCRGTTFPGRVCADLLTVAGLPELVTESLAEYEALAIALAGNPKRLAAIRQRVRTEAPSSPLFDTARYTRNLETAFSTMYEAFQAGSPPKSFSVG